MEFESFPGKLAANIFEQILTFFLKDIVQTERNRVGRGEGNSVSVEVSRAPSIVTLTTNCYSL